MEDLDPPREQPGAANSILNSLKQHGLHWDGQVMWQSERSAAYEKALDELAATGRVFRCYCSRQQLDASGNCCAHCGDRPADSTGAWALRLSINRTQLSGFKDQLQGYQAPDHDLENFTIKRKDGLYAYQLAVVVDDAEQNISHIVRGSDLMDSTPRQIHLQQALGYPSAKYCHLPVITNTQGQKLSKQNHAPALVDAQAPDNLRQALAFLQQDAPPRDLTDTASIIFFACSRWAIERIPGVLAVPQSNGV